MGGYWDNMAERRMFTKKVTYDDNFMSLSSSAQALYLHLSMGADDDGFCNQVSISMFKAHASVQDLQALLEKRYIYQFENGVIVIKHWRMANALRKDRYTPTAFQEELAKLDLKENGSYTWLPDGCQTVAGCLPQVRIDKNSKDNNNIYCVHFENVWKVYPRKSEKKKAYGCYKARLKEGYSEDELMQATVKYAEECKKEKREQRYIKLASTFFGVNTPFADYLSKNKDNQSEDGIRIYPVEDCNENPPYYGLPEEWYENGVLIKERMTPLRQPPLRERGIYEPIDYKVEDLYKMYEMRREWFENHSG